MCPDGCDNGVWAKAGFDNTTYDRANKGISFSISSPSKTWYPASGCRDAGGGLGSVGNGYYWSAFPGSNYAYSLSFYNNGYVFPGGYGSRSYGFSVRCVRE